MDVNKNFKKWTVKGWIDSEGKLRVKPAELYHHYYHDKQHLPNICWIILEKEQKGNLIVYSVRPINHSKYKLALELGERLHKTSTISTNKTKTFMK